ncbi:hypothetical protein ACQ4PT_071481 [Festuca glaucescens]
MALCLMRSRLGAGRSFATGIAKAISGGNNSKPVSCLGNVRRFSAGAGNNNNSGTTITKGCVLGAGLVVQGFGLRYITQKYVDSRLGSLDASQQASSTLSDEAKAELRRYVDRKFSEAQRLTKSFQAEAMAELARIRRQSDDSAERRAADEKKLAELTKEIGQIHGAVRADALLHQNSRVVDEGKHVELRSEFSRLRHEFHKTEQKLNTTLSQVSSRAADEKKLADLTKEIAQVHGEVRSCDRKLDSALLRQNSRTADEKKLAELTKEIAQVRGEVL